MIFIPFVPVHLSFQLSCEGPTYVHGLPRGWAVSPRVLAMRRPSVGSMIVDMHSSVLPSSLAVSNASERLWSLVTLIAKAYIERTAQGDPKNTSFDGGDHDCVSVYYHLALLARRRPSATVHRVFSAASRTIPCSVVVFQACTHEHMSRGTCPCT